MCGNAYTDTYVPPIPGALPRVEKGKCLCRTSLPYAPVLVPLALGRLVGCWSAVYFLSGLFHAPGSNQFLLGS